jgi:primosomal protein N' (replication factor Y)
VTQLAGRSGRDAPGRVVVQTFQPDATPLRHAVNHDVDGFLAGELVRREVLGYPPFRHLVSILVSGPEPGAPLAALREVRGRLEGVDAVLLGPAAVLRLRGRHRAQLLAKTTQPRSVARHASTLLAAAARTMRRDGLTAVVDVDPQSL